MVMSNIFEGAKFGDKFLTRDGRIAIYQGFNIGWHHLFTDINDMFVYNSGEQKDGLTEQDIVVRYKEPINEEKLEELAYEQQKKSFCSFAQHCSGIGIGCMLVHNSYKAGYKKAKEE